MSNEPTYGAVFVERLTTLGRHVPYRYEDLRRIKEMSQADLADWIEHECREFSQVIRGNPAEVAAEMVHRRRTAAAESSPASLLAECSLSLLELLPYLFS